MNRYFISSVFIAALSAATFAKTSAATISRDAHLADRPSPYPLPQAGEETENCPSGFSTHEAFAFSNPADFVTTTSGLECLGGAHLCTIAGKNEYACISHGAAVPLVQCPAGTPSSTHPDCVSGGSVAACPKGDVIDVTYSCYSDQTNCALVDSGSYNGSGCAVPTPR